MLLGPVIY
uniref:Uncharacterized protein n=1 Tax=Rhizophora mucronata TaxID=61149 RepID=A0A2P2R2V1_RHIMU